MSKTTFKREVLKTLWRNDRYSAMFFAYGLLLGTLYIWGFNGNGKTLVTKIVSELSSPDLFLVLWTTAGITIPVYTIFKGPLNETIPLWVDRLGFFPASVALDVNRSLFSFILGLSPGLGYSSACNLVAIGTLMVVLGFASSLLAFTLVFSRRQNITDPRFLERSKIGATPFTLIQVVVFCFMLLTFVWQFVIEDA